MPFDLSPPPQEEITKEQLTPPLTDVQRVLNEAADYVEKFGLAKHIQRDRDMSLCVHGAIVLATGGVPCSMEDVGNTGDHALECAATKALAKYLLATGQKRGVYLRHSFAGMAEWNNEPTRTKEQVVSALRSASLRAGGEQK